MLSDGVAMSLYIVPRATRDFDFVVHLKPEDADAFVENFKEDITATGKLCRKPLKYEACLTL